jgi:hypothetical protein
MSDAMRLMAYVAAGGHVTSIWRGPESEPDEHLAKLRGVFVAHQVNEIPRLLVSIAAMLRAKLDDGSWNACDESVGWIADGTLETQSNYQQLSVREACNKILHARDVVPVEHRDTEGRQFFGALIRLIGERGQQRWCGELNMQAFCIALANTDFYARGGRPCEH